MSQRFAKKVLLIGWDAADWKVIHPLLDAGLMPNLEGFVNEGVIGNISTLDPPFSPMLWTSVATGKTADKHGVLDFVQPDPENNRLRPVLGTSRKVKAIWNILCQEGMRTHTIGWWPSHPAEPINGVSVSDFYHQPNGPYGEPWTFPPQSVHPERLIETMADLRIHPGELTSAHILPFVPRAHEVNQDKDQALSLIANLLAKCASIHAAATYAMEHEPWDFMAVYYEAIDRFSHHFMKFHPPRRDHIPEKAFALYKDVITAVYRFHDMMLGRLLTLAGPDTTIILLSDHGFHPDESRLKHIPDIPAGIALEHRQFGMLCMRGPHLLRDERISGASLLDITPTILTLFGLPVGRDMDGQPLIQAWQSPPSPDYIPSWEEVAGEDGRYPDDLRQDPWAEQTMMNRLVAMGYVEAPQENIKEAIDNQVRESQFGLARVYLERKRYGDARLILEKIFQQDPTLRYGAALIDCYLAQNELDKARGAIETLGATVDESQQINIDLLNGKLMMAEKQPQAALALYQANIDQYPDQPDLLQLAGHAYLELKAWSQAETAFQKMLTIDSEQVMAYRGLTVAYLNQGLYEDAAEAALDALGLIYFQPLIHYYLGEALRLLGDYQQAAGAYQVAISQAPRLKRAYLRLADLYDIWLGNPAAAAEYRRLAEDIIQR